MQGIGLYINGFILCMSGLFFL